MTEKHLMELDGDDDDNDNEQDELAALTIIGRTVSAEEKKDSSDDANELGETPSKATAIGENQLRNDNMEEFGEKIDTDNARTEKKTLSKKAPTRTTDWPLRDIKEPHENDVLYGRGGGTNHHPGNKRYRRMVEERKVDYVNSKRLDKPLVALEIIREWRAQDPPGRFLKLDERTGMWHDVGDKKAREKTSQALREKAPLIRKQQEEERVAHDRTERGDDEDSDEDKEEDEDEKEHSTKTTRFAEGTKADGNVSKAVLARDHSLGREYLQPDQKYSLEGFSWQDPFQNAEEPNPPVPVVSHSPPPALPPSASTALPPHEGHREGHQRMGSHGSYAPPPLQAPPPPPPHGYPHEGHREEHQRMGSHGSYAPPPQGPPPPPHGYHPSSRIGSHGSYGAPPPDHRYSSHGSLGPPAPPPLPSSYPPRMASDDRHYGYPSHGRYESWGSLPGGQTPPPLPGVYGYGGPWGRDSSMAREHSLGQNPLPHASVSHAATYTMFDGRNASGQWGHPPPPYSSRDAPPPYPYSSVGSGPYSGPNAYSVAQPHPHAAPPPPPAIAPPPLPASSKPIPVSSPSPPYSVDPAVASTWSGQDANEIAKSWSNSSGEEYDRFRSTPTTSPRDSSHKDCMPKPDMVKRATSNQNETPETKPSLQGPSVKRAALSRDKSSTSNRLKEKYIPGYCKKNDSFDTEREMSKLSSNLEQSSLGVDQIAEGDDNDDMPFPASVQPAKPFDEGSRSSTMDMIAMDLALRPVRLSSSSRSTTIDALALDLNDDDMFFRLEQDRTSMDDVFQELREGYSFSSLSKPPALSTYDRLTTNEFFEIVNEPIGEDEPEIVSGKSDDRSFDACKKDATAQAWIAGV